VLVTDEGENVNNEFANAMVSWKGHFTREFPDVVIVRLGGNRFDVSDRIEKSLRKVGCQVEVLDAVGMDAVAMPNLLQLLSRKSIFDLIQEVLETELPQKSEWDARNLSVEVSDAEKVTV